MITAKLIADSKNEFGDRLTTFVVTFPRIVLAEFNTHRMLSKNSASSRAIPFRKMVETMFGTSNLKFTPIRWMKEHKGMQGTEYFTDINDIVELDKMWDEAALSALEHAEKFSNKGVTKQICNRLLEPFMLHTVIVTGTDWENFFALRTHNDAEIHIQKLAYVMLDVYNENIPKILKSGEWHIPYEDEIILPPTIPIDEGLTLEEGVNIRKVKISTAKCARVSYTVIGNTKETDYQKDIELHDKFVTNKPLHASPFEHCGRCMTKEERQNNKGYNKNFKGFIQYRSLLENENSKDNRVIK